MDIAALGLTLDARPIDTATESFTRFVGAGSKAENTAAAVGSATAAMGSAIAGASVSQSQLAQAQGAAVATASNLATAYGTQARSASLTNSATREMAEAIKQADAEMMSAYQSSRTAAAGNTALAASTKQAAVSYGDFYNAAQKDFATQYVSQFNASTVATKKLSEAHGSSAASANMQRLAMMELQGSARGVFDGLAAGQNPLRILTMEGGRLTQAISMSGGLGGALGMLVGLISPVVVGLGIVATAVGVVTAAFILGRGESEKLNKAIAATGDYAGVTAGQYEGMVHAIQSSTDAGFGKVRETLMTLVASGKFTHDQLQVVSEDILTLARLSGQSADEVTKQFSKMSDGPADFAEKFNAAYHLLTFAQLEHIRLLEEQGDKTQAILAAAIAIHQELGTKGPENLGYLERAWRGVAGAIGEAWDNLKGFGREQAPDQRLRNVEADIASVQQAMQHASGPGSRESYQARLDADVRERDALQAVVAQSQAHAAAQAQAAQNTDRATEAAARMRGEWAGMGDHLSVANREIAKYRADIEAIRKADPHSTLLPTSAQQTAAESDIRKRYMPDASHDATEAQHRAEALAREAAATEATIDGNIRLAKAYQISGAEALRQAATTKATAAGLKAQGDVAAFVDRQIRLDVAEQAAAGAKTLSQLTAETAARKRMNDEIAAGHITVAQANEQLKDEAVLRPLLAAQANAHGEALVVLTGIINDLKVAQADANKTAQDSKLVASIADQTDQLAILQKQLDLVTATNLQRAVEIAHLQAIQQLKKDGSDPTSDLGKEYIANAEANAAATVKLADAQGAFNYELTRTGDLFGHIDDMARDAASGFSKSFDGLGAGLQHAAQGIGSLVTAMTALAKKEADIEAQRKKLISAGMKDTQEYKDFDIKATQDSARYRLEAYSDMAAAGQQFFKQNTAAYQVLQAAEIALHTIEMLNTIESMAADSTKTVSSVANSGVRASADGAAAFAKTLASVPFPYNLAAGATVLAALAAVGVMITGGGGSGSVPGANDAADRQARQGTGSILGDTKAKSDSIAHSLQIVAANTNRDLEYSNGMLTALRSIDNQMGAVAAAVGRDIGPGGTLDTSNLNLGSSTQGPNGWTKSRFPLAWVLPGLFGTKTTNTLQDLGVQFNAQSIAEIMSGGLSGNTYEQVSSEKKKKFFGFTYSDKTHINTTTGQLDPDFMRQTQLLIGSLRDGVVEAASALGIQGAQATLDAFQLNLGKLSFKDMSADEIQKALENVFSKAADDMAGAVMPMLAQFQKAGEGQFETLTRLAREYQVTDITLQSIGKTFGAVGVNSIAARDRLVELMGGMDQLQSATAAYADAFLTDAEKMAPIRQAVDAELTRLGLSNVKTRDQFKAVVQGLDVSTEAGAQLYAAMMNLAPAFAKVTEAAGDTQAVIDARSALSDAYDRESGALKDTISTFTDLAKGLHDYGVSLYTGPAAALSPEQQYLANKAEFERVSGLAKGGDKDALGQLQNVSQAYLDASKSYYASSQGYFADLAAVKDAVTAAGGIASHQADVATQQLDQMTSAVGQLIDLNQHVVSVADAIAALQTALAAQAPAPVPAPPPTTTGAGSGSGGAVNDNNADLAALLQQVIAHLQAGNLQQGSGFTALIGRLDMLTDAQRAALREALAA